jgi:hypothetical protein
MKEDGSAARVGQALCFPAAQAGSVRPTVGKLPRRGPRRGWLTVCGGNANRPVFLGRETDIDGPGGSPEEEGLHRGRLMLPAGPGLRAGANRRGDLQASLSGAKVAAHQAVEADQRGRSGPAPPCWITALSSVLALTVRSDDAAGTASQRLQEGQHGAEVAHRPHPAGWARQARASGVSSAVTVARSSVCSVSAPASAVSAPRR